MSEYRNHQKNIKQEKRVLNLSLYGVVFFIVVESLMALVTSSQSVLIDAVYGGADFIMIMISIKIVPLLYRPTSEKYPFGYSQAEAFFIAIKGIMMTAVSIALVLNNVQIILNGGNHVSFSLIAVFELIAGILCTGILFLLIKMNRELGSPLVKAEISAWKIDSIASAALAIAFVLPVLIDTPWMASFQPYLDQVVAITLSAFILPVPIKTAMYGIRDLFLLAPDEDTLERIKEIAQEELGPKGANLTSCEIIKTGRKLWISIYFRNQSDSISVSMIIKTRQELEERLRAEFKELYVELIPEFESSFLQKHEEERSFE